MSFHSQAITSTGFGTIDKMFLEYEQPWWPKDCEGIQIVWTKDIPDFDNFMQNSQLVDGTVEEVRVFGVFRMLTRNIFSIARSPTLYCAFLLYLT